MGYMLLLTKEIKERLVKHFNDNEAAHGEKKFKAVVKLFNPVGRGYWFLTELNPANNMAFGGAFIHDWDLGGISIDEIQKVKGPLGLGIERDISFKSNALTLEECRKMVVYRYVSFSFARATPRWAWRFKPSASPDSHQSSTAAWWKSSFV